MDVADQPHPGDNYDLLCQDCNRKLFNWFLSRIDWQRILKNASSSAKDKP
jgi:hypothetical protein